jgi:hypothetical protein
MIGQHEVPLPRVISQPEPIDRHAGEDALSAQSEQQFDEPRVPPSHFAPLHRKAAGDFLSPIGFGYVQDLDRVAGFQPHAFRKPLPAAPVSLPAWRVTTVELVSLLKYSSPMVYVSESLPSMQELQDAEVRPLDPLEQRGLARLRDGEEISMLRREQHVRMLGAIRVRKQCIECHHARVGELIGAFSYRFVADDQPGESRSAAPLL